MKYTNHQYITKVFHFVQNKLLITAKHSMFAREVFKRWRMFMPSSLNSAVRPNSLPNFEIYKNTNIGNSELTEIMNVHTINNSSPNWTRSIWAHDQVIQWTKAKVLVYSGENEWQHAVKRWESQVEEFKMSTSYTELGGNRLRNNWTRVKYFPRFSSLQILQEKQNDLRQRNIEPENSQNEPSLQCSFEFRKSRNTRKDSCKDTGRSSVLEMNWSCMELFLIHLEETGTL